MEIKRVIRVCNTWPSENREGIGLHAFQYSKNIKVQTDVFIRNIKGDKFFMLDNVIFHKLNLITNNSKSRSINIFQYFLKGLITIQNESVFLLRILNFLINNDTDKTIIHMHCPHFLISCYLVSHFFKLPVIFQIGGSEMIRIKNSPLHKLIIKKIKYFICVNNDLISEVKLINKKATFLNLGNGIDLNQFKAKTIKNINQYTSTGNLRWQKDQITLIKAFNIFSKENPSAFLNIFGEGPLRSVLEKQIIKLNLQDKVFLKGYCSQEEIHNSLSNSFLYLQTSVSEGFPKSILEAISSACPIVVTNVGSCKELANQFGMGVEPQSPQKFAEAIKCLNEDKKLWDSYQKKCLLKRESYSWSNVIAKIKNYYKRVL